MWEPSELTWIQGDYRRKAKASSHPDFGVRVDTVHHTYLFRRDGGAHSRDIRIFCYDKERLRAFIKKYAENKNMIKEKTTGDAGSQKAPAKIQPPVAGRKRENSISGDKYFMGVASLSAMRSRNPNTQVGCCIVGAKNRIASVGYNGFPFGCDDDEYPWSRHADGLEECEIKYPYVVHSEINAILNYRGEDVRDHVPVLRMCESDHPVWDPGSDLL